MPCIRSNWRHSIVALVFVLSDTRCVPLQSTAMATSKAKLASKLSAPDAGVATADEALVRKWGLLKAGRVLLVAAPVAFRTSLGLGDRVAVDSLSAASLRPPAEADVVALFARNKRDLPQGKSEWESLRRHLALSGGLWIAYPKKSAKAVATDLSFADVQAAGLAAGLVDNKNAAVDKNWTSLRFVFRVADRAAEAERRASTAAAASASGSGAATSAAAGAPASPKQRRRGPGAAGRGAGRRARASNRGGSGGASKAKRARRG